MIPTNKDQFQVIDKQISSDENNYFHKNEYIMKPNSSVNISVDDYKAVAEEFLKCKNSCEYFTSNYFYITNLDHGKIVLKMYKKQAELLDFLQNNKRVAVLASRQSGKCTIASTKITIRNKTTGEISVVNIENLKLLNKK